MSELSFAELAMKLEIMDGERRQLCIPELIVYHSQEQKDLLYHAYIKASVDTTTQPPGFAMPVKGYLESTGPIWPDCLVFPEMVGEGKVLKITCTETAKGIKNLYDILYRLVPARMEAMQKVFQGKEKNDPA